MAEIIMRDLITKNKRRGITVSSAGTYAEIGAEIAPYAIISLQKNGVSIPKKQHLGTQITQNMLGIYDHIVCMTQIQRWQIDPRGVHSHVYTLDKIDIPDPWIYNNEQSYDIVCKHLLSAVTALYYKICKT
jgi:protein-tyrosine-phosphatase